jgi:hypothetical protein
MLRAKILFNPFLRLLYRFHVFCVTVPAASLLPGLKLLLLFLYCRFLSSLPGGVRRCHAPDNYLLLCLMPPCAASLLCLESHCFCLCMFCVVAGVGGGRRRGVGGQGILAVGCACLLRHCWV